LKNTKVWQVVCYHYKQQDCLFWRILKSRANPLGTRVMLVTWLGTWSNGRNSPRGFMVEKSGLSGSSDICQQARRNRMGTCNFSRVSLLAARTKFVRAGWAGENHDEIPTHVVMLGHG
jgi:hypothetical protein